MRRVGPGCLDLALRLALGGDRDSRVRLAVVTAGLALGVAMLVGVTGVLPAALDRAYKPSARGVVFADTNEDDRADQDRTEGVRAELSVGFWRGRDLRVLRTEVVGPPVAPPPGIPRVPGSGEVFVSPGLADALAGPHRAEVAPRLPGTVIGTVGRPGLVGPDELFAVAGAAPGDIVGQAGFLSPGFESPDASSAVVDGSGWRTENSPSEETWVAVLLAGVGLLVPIVVLVGTLTRLSAAGRERRAGAMRLVGATARQLRTIGAVEGALVGAAGSLGGAALFLLLRRPVASLVPVTHGVFGEEVAPHRIAWLLVLVGVPVLTAVSGSIALRRAVSSPLGVRRQAEVRRAGASRLVPLALGLVLVALAYVRRGTVLGSGYLGLALLVAGASLCLVGIALAGPALTRLTGLALARFGPGTASQLAGRRLVMDPTSSARAVTGTALAVVVIGCALAYLPLLGTGGDTRGARLATVLLPGTVVVPLDARADVAGAAARVGRVDGVAATASVRTATVTQAGDAGVASGGKRITAIVADCSHLEPVLRASARGCRPGTAQQVAGGELTAGDLAGVRRLQTVTLDGDGRELARGPAFPVGDLSQVRLPVLDGWRDGFSMYGDLVVPPAFVGDGATAAGLLVATNGRASTVEAVRTALRTAATDYPPVTPAEAAASNRAATDGFRWAALAGVLTVVLVGGISLAVTTADGLQERRRPHAALTALGTPVAVLRRSVLLQAALPLLLNVALALSVAAATSWLYVRLNSDRPPPLPWVGFGAIGATAVAACLIATCVALPFVREASRPDALRTE